MELIKPTVVTLQSVETLSENELELPVFIKDKVLLSPGNWNGITFSAESIREAYELTDWADKDNYALIYDHDPKAVNWLGNIVNHRISEDGSLVGDLEIWDEDLARKLVLGKAKLGISARVLGFEDDEGNFAAKQFNNFSVVYEPACKNAYINLSQSKDLQKELLSKFKELLDFMNKLELVGETGAEETKGKDIGKSSIAKTNQPIKYKKKKKEDEEPEKEDKPKKELESTESLSEGVHTSEKEDKPKESKMTEENLKKTEVMENESPKMELSEELSNTLNEILSVMKELSEKVAKLEEAPVEEPKEEVKEEVKEEAPKEEVAEEKSEEAPAEESEELTALKAEVKELKAEKEAVALSTPEVQELSKPISNLLGGNLTEGEKKLREALLNSAKQNGL